jgi:hypothetical protein
LFPSINGYFSDERRSPRVSALDVLKAHLPATAGQAGENPCACPVKCEAYFTGAAPAKMSGISHLIYKMKVLSFSSKKYLIYE